MCELSVRIGTLGGICVDAPSILWMRISEFISYILFNDPVYTFAILHVHASPRAAVVRKVPLLLPAQQLTQTLMKL